MTSIRQIMANRVNARKSTGPKTPAGKARVSRNSLRHGFRAEALCVGGYSPEVEEFARVIAGNDASGERYEYACRVAAAQLHLTQVRVAKRGLQTAANFGYVSDDHDAGNRKSPDWKLLLPISHLDGYEQRALTRRRRAIREFTAFPGAEDNARNFCRAKPIGENAMNSVPGAFDGRSVTS